MQTNYYIVNLVNGLNLVGDIEHTPDDIVIKFPLEITAKSITDNDGKIIGEHMVLRPFLVMTDDREVVVDRFNVLCSMSLSQRLFSSYEEMVENVYGKDVSFEGNFYKNEEDDIDAEEDYEAKDIEELNQEEANYLKEQLESFIESKDKTVH
jgi:hypothetical protein